MKIQSEERADTSIQATAREEEIRPEIPQEVDWCVFDRLGEFWFLPRFETCGDCQKAQRFKASRAESSVNNANSFEQVANPERDLPRIRLAGKIPDANLSAVDDRRLFKGELNQERPQEHKSHKQSLKAHAMSQDSGAQAGFPGWKITIGSRKGASSSFGDSRRHDRKARNHMCSHHPRQVMTLEKDAVNYSAPCSAHLQERPNRH